MLKENFKKILLYTIIILVIFFVDRISKLYVIGLAEIENTVDVALHLYDNIHEEHNELKAKAKKKKRTTTKKTTKKNV